MTHPDLPTAADAVSTESRPRAVTSEEGTATNPEPESPLARSLASWDLLPPDLVVVREEPAID